MTMYQCLSHLAGVTEKLQKQANDIVEAPGMIREVVSYVTLLYFYFTVHERPRSHQLQFHANLQAQYGDEGLLSS